MEFAPFTKIARLSREVTITEKLDGTNGCIYIRELPDNEEMPTDTPITMVHGNLLLYAGSRTRWITPDDDNYGFAKWVRDNAPELARLGPGTHFGEWWGQGIQRNYAQPRKRFSLFNTSKWSDDALRPACCDVVPVLYNGVLDEFGVLKGVKSAMKQLQEQGSAAAPGFMNPEGIIIYHHAANLYFKKTLHKDEEWKGKQKAA